MKENIKYKGKHYVLANTSEWTAPNCIACDLHVVGSKLGTTESCIVQQSERYHRSMGVDTNCSSLLELCGLGIKYFKQVHERRRLVVGDNTQTPSQD